MLLTALMLAAQPPPAATEIPGDSLSFALRCLLISAQVRQSTDPQIRARGTAQSLYYFGRIDGRIPESELQARMTQELRAMDGVDPHAVDRACDDYLRSRGLVLSRAGRGMVNDAGARPTGN